MLKLVGTDGQKYYSWVLTPGEYGIGRTSDNDFHIPHKTVSRKHAIMHVNFDKQCFLADQGSHNGTFVNGKRVSNCTPVRLDDSIMFDVVRFLGGIIHFRIKTQKISGVDETRTRDLLRDKQAF